MPSELAWYDISSSLAARCPLAYLIHLFPVLSTWSLLPAVLSCPALPKSHGHLGSLLHLSFLPISTG